MATLIVLKRRVTFIVTTLFFPAAVTIHHTGLIHE
jgi:hypothetical protein